MELHNELSSLKSTVDQLAKDIGRTKNALDQLAQNSTLTTQMLQRMLVRFLGTHSLVPSLDLQR
jgi:prefoldin subunit 5